MDLKLPKYLKYKKSVKVYKNPTQSYISKSLPIPNSNNEDDKILCNKDFNKDINKFKSKGILFNKKRKVMDNSNIYNISAITQKDEIFNGWIFRCNECGQKTSNSIICDTKYELYICRICISSKTPSDKVKLLSRSIKYCRDIAKTKINIV